jgi:hypothetical protein
LATLKDTVTGLAIATTICYHTLVYVAALLHRYSINSVLHFSSPLYVTDTQYLKQVLRNNLRTCVFMLFLLLVPV